VGREEAAAAKVEADGVAARAVAEKAVAREAAAAAKVEAAGVAAKVAARPRAVEAAERAVAERAAVAGEGVNVCKTTYKFEFEFDRTAGTET
jgi:hypothetical protein